MEDSQSDDEELLNNEDYRNLQEVINSLKKQRDRALKNVNLLQQLKEDALTNPMQFVADLKEKKLVNFPSRQEISSLPIIDFSKYQKGSTNNNSSNSTSSSFSPTSQTKQNNNTNHNINNNSNHSNSNTNHSKGSNNNSSSGGNNKKANKNNGVSENKLPQPGDVVRGRVFTQSKPRSFNKLWSPEEQKKLEDLLLKYPHEKVAAHRWEKIAKALGTRTPKQVASRTQKYFIKLAKRGLDVPGKLPNLEYYTSSRAKKRKRRQKAAALLNQQRSGNNLILPRSNPTLFKMSDDSDDYSDSDDLLSDSDPLNDEQSESISIKKIKLDQTEVIMTDAPQNIIITTTPIIPIINQ